MPRNDHQFQQLINTASRLAYEHQQAMHRLGDAFEARYGQNYSDADCEGVIDVCDYNGGRLSVSEADKLMAEVGFPRLPKEEAET